jgi:hypothetical protein
MKLHPLHRNGLVASYAVVGALAYVLGAKGLVPWGRASNPSTSTPLTRIGFALQTKSPNATPEAWAALRADVEQVRATIKEEDRSVFDFVVALRGLSNDGNAEWVKAEELCRGLQWARCDRATLEAAKAKGIP